MFMKVLGISSGLVLQLLMHGHLLASGHSVSLHSEDHNAPSLTAPKAVFANMFCLETYNTFGSREAVAVYVLNDKQFLEQKLSHLGLHVVHPYSHFLSCTNLSRPVKPLPYVLDAEYSTHRYRAQAMTRLEQLSPEES